jgi:hypothetical protein
MNYLDVNFNRNAPSISTCYICNKDLEGKTTKDHIIPQSLFHKDCGERPYLLVHKHCNTGKSLDDEKFVIRMQLMCNWRPQAQQDVLPFLEVANQEASDAYLVGRRVRNYKLKRMIAREFKEDYQAIINGQHLVQVRVSDEHANAMKQYAVSMAYGLLLRNLPNAKVDISKVDYRWFDYFSLNNQGLFKKNMDNIGRLLQTASQHDLLFGQAWEGLVEYYGSKTNEAGTSGFIYIEFYKAIGIWVNFHE